MPSEDPYWRTRPGGLSAVDFNFPTEPRNSPHDGYYNIDFFLKVEVDPGSSLAAYEIPNDVKPGEDVLGCYWSHQFAFSKTGNGVDGYLGIQTTGSISRFDPKHKSDPSKNIHVKNTRIAIFSIWNAIDARPGAPGSFCAPYDHEGSGWSCKLEYHWKQGVSYCLRLWELADARTPDKPEWWRAAIIDLDAGHEQVIGDICVPQGHGWLKSHASMFTEYYSQTVNQAVGDEDDGKSNPRVCTYMPKARVLITPPKANNRTVSLKSMTPRNYGKCAASSQFFITMLGKKIVIPSGHVVETAAPVHNETGHLDPKPPTR